MERKLVKQGRNALTVTLPAHWLQQKGLKQGDVIFIHEKNSEILITALPSAEKKEATIHAEDAGRSDLYNHVLGKYIEGYDTIVLHHANPLIAQDISRALLGMVIEFHTQNKTVYKSVISTPEQNFESIVRRATFILQHQAELLKDSAEGKENLEEIRAQENLLDFNLLYCLRYLNKYERSEKAYKYFLLCSILESVGDQLVTLAKSVGKNKKLAADIAKLVHDYTELIYKKDLKKLNAALKHFAASVPQSTFAEGIAFSLAETMKNFLGYVAD